MSEVPGDGNNPRILEYEKVTTLPVSIKYTVGGNGRGENRQELIIKNW
ncbi:MAG: hypothetical protein WCP10_13880 [Desulfuromonadales bacterium]